MSSESLQSAFQRLSDRVAARLDESSPHDDHEHRVPPADVVETPTEFVVVLDLPAYDPDSIEIRATDNTLHVAADPTPTDELEADDATALRRERTREPVSRTLALPQEVDETESHATYADGVLTVTLAKDEEEQPGHYVDVD